MSFLSDKVSAANFYKDDGDKIRLNWFLYEYANMLHMNIISNPKLKRYRKLHTEDQIAVFCIYFSKRMRKSIYDRQIGKTNSVVFNGKYVYEFYPDSSYAQTQWLLELALDTWNEQLQNCGGCPNECLNDGFEITEMFDKLEKTGWPT